MSHSSPIFATVGIKEHIVNCIIGVYPQERIQEQPLLLDIEWEVDVSRSVSTDGFADAVDYEQVAAACADLAIQKKYQLIETFAHEALELLLSRWPISRAKIRVQKPQALKNTSCAYVEMERKAR
jgi:dihydroneopterin aldolase